MPVCIVYGFEIIDVDYGQRKYFFIPLRDIEKQAELFFEKMDIVKPREAVRHRDSLVKFSFL